MLAAVNSIKEIKCRMINTLSAALTHVEYYGHKNKFMDTEDSLCEF